MALNQGFKYGESISMKVPSGTKSGDALRLGVINAVAVVDEGTGGNAPGWASVDLFGGHYYEIAGATEADVEKPVYITSAGDLTLTASGNKLWGAITHHDRGERFIVLVTAISV